MSRAYTLKEIDAIRDYYRRQTETVMVDPTYGIDIWPEDFDMSPYPIEVKISAVEAEMRVRTAMLAGADPDQLTAPSKPSPPSD